MEKELNKAKFRLMTLDDEQIYRKYVSRMNGDISARICFAFMHLYMPFVQIYIRETEHFLLLIQYDKTSGRAACLPPLGDWETASLRRPLDIYRRFFDSIGAETVMVDVSEWMLPVLKEAGFGGMRVHKDAGFGGMRVHKDAEESDCLFTAKDYALSLMREQTRLELEKISANQELRWEAYSEERREAFYQAIRSVYDARLKKMDSDQIYRQFYVLIAPLDMKLQILWSGDNPLGILGYRLLEGQMEILMYYAALRPKWAEAVVRRRICEGMNENTREILIAGAYCDKSLIAGRQAELRSRQLYNYVIGSGQE